MVKKVPRLEMRALIERAGYKSAELARLMGYASASGFNRYELSGHGDKPIPAKVVKELMPHLVGRGSPPITREEVLALTGLVATAPPPASGVARQTVPLTSPRAVPVKYRIDVGVFVEAAAVGHRNYGDAPFLVSPEFPPLSQFAAAVVTGGSRAVVVHCVPVDEVGEAYRAGRRYVGLRQRGTTDLVEVVLSTYDPDGNPVQNERPVGVVVAAYVRE